MRHLAQQWLSAHWPSQCLLCQRWPAQPVCADCRQRFARPQTRCTACALPLYNTGATQLCGHCLRQPSSITCCTVAVDYAYPWAGVLQRWKLHDQPALTPHICRWLPQAALHACLQGVEVTLPIPIAPQRLAQRGYHQSLLLARAWQAPNVQAGILLRSRHTPPQTQHDRAHRLRNLRGAFTIAQAHLPALQGRHVLLVDDIITTGATVQAAARTVLAAGAASVHVLAVARTPAHAAHTVHAASHGT